MRHFYRCTDCLSVVATDTAIQTVRVPPNGMYSYGECGACNWAIEYMGEVCRDHLQKTALVCACDDRCTSALGPVCSCRCGGENHGTNRVVEVVIEVGKLPRLMVPPDAKVKADEYRALLAEVRAVLDARYGRLFQMKRDGIYLSGSDFCDFCEGGYYLRAITKARTMRTHAGRNKRLRGILDQIRPVPSEVCA